MKYLLQPRPCPDPHVLFIHIPFTYKYFFSICWIFRHERDGLKFEVHQNSLEVISLKEDIQSLEQQLASQSKAVEWIKSEARDALQREALYRSELEDELKKVTKVKISNF